MADESNSTNKLTQTSLTNEILKTAPLGKKSSTTDHYDPTLLFPLPRQPKREEIGLVESSLPFFGFDAWTGFEISWLNEKGKPIVAIGEFRFPCESRCLIESKSFKLYLNSFNNSKFESFNQVQNLMIKDLSETTGSLVDAKLFPLQSFPSRFSVLEGTCLDDLDVECSQYQPEPSYLVVEEQDAEETLTTDLLKSNCLVTGQPDWGSVQISYQGKKISHPGLLKYIVSLRNHNEFHEQCVERIFMDIMSICKPKRLSVYARYTRRGGLDINPFRTNVAKELSFDRLIRQ